MKYTYEVWREGIEIYYKILRDGKKVENQKRISFLDLGFWESFNVKIHSEKQIGLKFNLAHKQAKEAVANLIKYERM